MASAVGADAALVVGVALPIVHAVVRIRARASVGAVWAHAVVGELLVVVEADPVVGTALAQAILL